MWCIPYFTNFLFEIFCGEKLHLNIFWPGAINIPQTFSNKRQASRPLQKTQTEHKALMQAKMYLVKVRVSEVTESKLHTY